MNAQQMRPRLGYLKMVQVLTRGARWGRGVFRWPRHGKPHIPTAFVPPCVARMVQLLNGCICGGIRSLWRASNISPCARIGAHCVELCIPCYIPINEVARPRSRTASRATQTTPGAAQRTQDEIQGRSWCIAALDLKFAPTRATERRMRYRFLGLSRQIRFRLYSHSNVSALSVNNKAPLCRNWESNKKEKPSQHPPHVTQNGTAVPFATDPERPGG